MRFVVLAKIYLDGRNCEFIQMTAIVSAAGEYFVGDRDKGVAIYSILNLEHCRHMISDGNIQKAAQENAVM